MQTLYKYLLIFSPGLAALAAGIIYNLVGSDPGNMALGVVIGVLFFFGIPFVIVVGSLFNYVSNRKSDIKQTSLMGYLFGAMLTWLYAFYSVFS